MDASVIVAICATVIAVVSLAVSVYEARATRRHNRISVRPFLELRVNLSQGVRQACSSSMRPRAGGHHQDCPDVGWPATRGVQRDERQCAPRQAVGPPGGGHIPADHPRRRVRSVPAEH